ncbi:hypothetical protein, partial [Streptomyces olivochromogenes]|uniref:hypothetical protein n=1 Tax=Streptomyces olivochromogenes TaxID=1963 RepID=UPI001F1E2F48
MHDARDQVLAVTLAVLLLTGTALLVSCWMGPLATFTTVAALVVTAYAAPGLARRLTVRRAFRELQRSLMPASRRRASLRLMERWGSC